MSSSTGEPPNKGIDGTVGGLVWVRRRNGSWWPGRIMGLDELPESCLVSPRLGTPVKLLGRKDASIDWYNLEKSKRVKAFRCGEYDECIEKAKASAAILSKKTVKYARREDAIMHALELESSRMGNDHPDLYPRNHSAGKDGTSIMESPTVSESGQGTDEISGDESDFDNDSLSAVELSHSGISFEEPNRSIASKLQAAQGRRRTPNDSEDDGTEGTKRMRGLEDLGMGTASNKKIQVGTVVDHGQPDTTPGSSTVNCVANGNLVNGYKGYPSSLKRRRSQVAAVHDFLKKKNRRRPLTKVLESTAMVSVPVICNPIASSSGNCLGTASETSGLEPIDSKRSTSMVTTNNSGSAGISQDDELTGNASEHARRTEDAQRKMKLKGTSCLAALPENELPHVLFDVPFIGEGKHSRGKVSQAIEKGTSKWQSKGKRNSRHLSENQKRQSAKYTEMDDDPGTHSGGLDNSDVFSQGSDQRVDGNCIDGSPTSYAKMKSGAVRQVDGAIECGSRVVLGESHMKRQAEVKLLPDGSPSTQKSLPYRQSRLTVHSRYKTADYPTGDYLSNSPLYDVELEVQASYRPPHVPLVSLMSKLNGKAIVGHPLTVEVVNDGYCDNNLMNRVNHDLRNATAWGRPDIRPAVQRSGGFAKRTNKSSSRKKSSKMKKSGSLSKKMRKLSSLTGQKRNEEAGQFSVEKPMGPVIACIPLKVVFSRINEAVNGSVRLTHRSLASNN